MMVQNFKAGRTRSLFNRGMLALLLTPCICYLAPIANAQQSSQSGPIAPQGYHEPRSTGGKLTDFFRGLVQIREKEDGGMEIKAPFVNVNRDRNGVNVKAPFTDVGSSDRRVRVRAPFTNVGEEGNRVGVHAPFADVDSDYGRTRVRAPFTRIGEPNSDNAANRFKYPNSNPPESQINERYSPKNKSAGGSSAGSAKPSALNESSLPSKETQENVEDNGNKNAQDNAGS